MNLVYPIYNLRILDFASIYKKYAEPKLIDDVNRYDLIKDNQLNIKSTDVKRLFYHHIIFELCEYILNSKSKEKVVILYCDKIPIESDLLKYIPLNDRMKFFNTLISKIMKMLPLKILSANISFGLLKRNKNSGECADIVTAAKCIADKYDISKFTYSKARYFANANGLEYLSNNYFKKVKSKQLIYQ